MVSNGHRAVLWDWRRKLPRREWAFVLLLVLSQFAAYIGIAIVQPSAWFAFVSGVIVAVLSIAALIWFLRRSWSGRCGSSYVADGAEIVPKSDVPPK